MKLREETKVLALSSMMVALSIVLQWLGAITQIGSYTAAVISGLLLVPIMDVGKLKYGVLSYFAVSFLSWVLIPDKEIPVVYMLFCFTPLIEPVLEKKFAKFVRHLIEFAIFIGVCLVAYPLIAKVFLMSDLEAEFQMSARLVELGFIGITSFIFALFLRCYSVMIKRWEHFKQHNKIYRRFFS